MPDLGNEWTTIESDLELSFHLLDGSIPFDRTPTRDSRRALYAIQFDTQAELINAWTNRSKSEDDYRKYKRLIYDGKHWIILVS